MPLTVLNRIARFSEAVIYDVIGIFVLGTSGVGRRSFLVII